MTVAIGPRGAYRRWASGQHSMFLSLPAFLGSSSRLFFFFFLFVLCLERVVVVLLRFAKRSCNELQFPSGDQRGKKYAGRNFALSDWMDLVHR